MIVGMFGKDGSAVVLPLDDMARVSGQSEYSIRQALEGKGKLAGQTVVKMPTGSVLRWPEKGWKP